jgi:NIPSNAP
MIIDHRTYSVKIGKLNEWLKLYETDALPLQLKYLGHCVGWYVGNDIGPLSQVVHMWAYRDLNDREARRGKMVADPAWGKFLEKSTALLVSMENKILRPAPWFTPPEMKA